MTCDEVFNDVRRYDDYRGCPSRSELTVEVEGGEQVNVTIDDGADYAQIGDEDREWTSHSMTFEQARRLVETLHPILYGES